MVCRMCGVDRIPDFIDPAERDVCRRCQPPDGLRVRDVQRAQVVRFPADLVHLARQRARARSGEGIW